MTENQTAKRQYNQQYQRKAYNSWSKYDRGKPTIVGPNMTEKRKNNKVYYNWPVSQANHGRVKMLFFKK